METAQIDISTHHLPHQEHLPSIINTHTSRPHPRKKKPHLSPTIPTSSSNPILLHTTHRLPNERHTPTAKNDHCTNRQSQGAKSSLPPCNASNRPRSRKSEYLGGSKGRKRERKDGGKDGGKGITLPRNPRTAHSKPLPTPALPHPLQCLHPP